MSMRLFWRCSKRKLSHQTKILSSFYVISRYPYPEATVSFWTQTCLNSQISIMLWTKNSFKSSTKCSTRRTMGSNRRQARAYSDSTSVRVTTIPQWGKLSAVAAGGTGSHRSRRNSMAKPTCTTITSVKPRFLKAVKMHRLPTSSSSFQVDVISFGHSGGRLSTINFWRESLKTGISVSIKTHKIWNPRTRKIRPSYSSYRSWSTTDWMITIIYQTRRHSSGT